MIVVRQRLRSARTTVVGRLKAEACVRCARLGVVFTTALLACGGLLSATAHPALAGSSPALIAFDDDATGVYEVQPGTKPGLAHLVARAAVFPEFSPNGMQLAYLLAHGTASGITSNSIVIADRTGGAPKVILSGSDKWDGAADAINYPLAWSPNGRELAYGCAGQGEVDGGGQWAAICVIDVDTGAHRMITRASDQHPLSESGPAERMNWTLDGKDIIADVLDPAPCPAFHAAGDRCGQDQVGSIDVSSGSVTLLTHTYQSLAPALSTDGKQILFYVHSPDPRAGQPYGLQIMDLDGAHERQVLDALTTNVYPGAIFSPNDRDILYTGYSTADQYHQQAYEVPVSGAGKPVMLTDGNVNVLDAVWTPLLTTCTVPNLRHKTLAQAKAALHKAACQLGKVKGPTSHRGKRHIVSQSLKPGRNAVAGTKVNVRIR